MSYWRNSAGVKVINPLKTLNSNSAGSWYPFQHEDTKKTSCKTK
jgi:hypothetical protein